MKRDGKKKVWGDLQKQGKQQLLLGKEGRKQKTFPQD